jgi:hypothetical protein
MVVLGPIVAFAVDRYVDERSSTDSGHGVCAYFDDAQGPLIVLGGIAL